MQLFLYNKEGKQHNMQKKVLNILFIFIVIITSMAVLDVYTSLLDERKTNEEALVGVLATEDERIDLKEYRGKYNNDEIVGRITIPGTTLNTLFAQTTDNKYYLRHNLKKEYNRLGSIFMDSRNEISDKQINLYAHNSIIYDNAPFKELSKFLDKEFVEGNDIIKIETEEYTRKYQVVSVKQTSNQEHMALKSNDFDNHIETIRSDSIYNNRQLDITEDDNILVLQTCVMNEQREIIVILAVEMK